MKKRILFSIILTALLACLFVIGASAATIYKDASGNTLFSYETFATKEEVTEHFGFANDASVGTIKSYTGSFPKTNEQGVELTWYVTATATEGSNTVITVSSGTTVGDVGSVNEEGVYSYNSGFNKQNIVSANFPDNAGIKKLGFGSYGSYSSSFPKANHHLLFIYCPNTLTEFGFNFIQSMPVIVCEIDDETPVTEIPQNFAHDARNLREINIPASVITINGDSGKNGAPFYANYSLATVTFASMDNLITMKKSVFSNCISLQTIKLPNSVTEIGERCFENCKLLTSVNLGASLVKTTGYSVFRLSNNLSVYYVPSTLTTVYQHTFTHDSGSGPANTVFFYAGTKTEFEAFYNASVSGKNNDRVTNGYKEEYVVEWDSTKPDSYYIDLATSENHKLYVINYNKCEAFYDGNHKFGETVYGFTGENYLSSFLATGVCENCESRVVEELCKALFTNKGYSKEEGGSFFTYGFVANRDEIAKYEKFTGERVLYGIIAANKSLSSDGALLDANGNAIEGAISADFTNMDYTIYNVKITGIGEENKASDLYCSAYVVDCGIISYIGNTVTDTSSLISYDKIDAIIPDEE